MEIPKRGFTLVEVLVVISIIVILSIIAVVFFSNVTKQVKYSKSKSDVSSIAKVLEAKYDSQSGQYPGVIYGTNFASGLLPTPPNGGHYTAMISSDSHGFRVCANVADTTSCSSSSCYCFCINSSQGGYTDVQLPLIIYDQ